MYGFWLGNVVKSVTWRPEKLYVVMLAPKKTLLGDVFWFSSYLGRAFLSIPSQGRIFLLANDRPESALACVSGPCLERGGFHRYLPAAAALGRRPAPNGCRGTTPNPASQLGPLPFLLL